MHTDLPQAGPSNTGISRYVVQTTDVLQDMRVTVCEEGSEKVIWYKERFLGDDEIVENVVHNATSRVQWSIHRPLRGWYIRIRSPAFPPGVFIPLTPVPSTSALHTEAALSFHTRTNIPTPPILPESSSQFTLQDQRSSRSSSSSIHSYPPTPTASTSTLSPPPPSTSDAESSEQTPRKTTGRPIAPRASSQITQFLLAAHSSQPVQQSESTSFLSRALSVLKSHQPSHSNSFTLSRVIAPLPTSPPPPYASSVSVATITGQPNASAIAILGPQQQIHAPLLVFHDRTPVLTVRSLTGLIEIDKAEERLVGVETSFWIAVALTYLEFLEERESYLAASSD
ncbi:hypothetical protein BDN70DRAFT_934888 [Pholiota conissans]|uniref:Uncharacterized protein n=1 Tax=Pholiota conissans TaxID=109636 RepID=A0A9P6CRV9_9AGAR|nr:hypothetical protein BDN70DRAFT_934888 [Pholiota conissans]